VRPFEAGLHEHLKSKHKEILQAIVATGKLEKNTEEALGKAIKEFKDRFVKENPKAQVAA
jgi:F0F1-type ATP synthase alpha subunit